MAGEQIANFLKPGCDNFYQKLIFFCIGESWEKGSFKAEEQVSSQAISLVKQKLSNKYYHTLFHLLSCPFCLDRAYDLLSPKSHEALPLLATKHPGEYIDIISKAKEHQDEQHYYFYLLYTKLVQVKPPGVFFQFFYPPQITTEIVTAKAAGEVEYIPPLVPIPFFQEQQISLCFEKDPIDDSFNIAIQGGSAKIRIALQLTIYYMDGNKEQLFGHEIAIGGMWSLTTEKAQKIIRIEIKYGDGE